MIQELFKPSQIIISSQHPLDPKQDLLHPIPPFNILWRQVFVDFFPVVLLHEFGGIQSLMIRVLPFFFFLLGISFVLGLGLKRHFFVPFGRLRGSVQS